jgi:hypothetical protein
MGIYGYAWEPHQVVTSDGYHLTLMEVTGKQTVQSDGTVVVTPSTGVNGNLMV